MGRVQLAKVDRFSLVRSVICVLPQQRSPQTDKLTKRLQRANRRVNNALVESLGRVSKLSEDPVPHVEANIQLIYRNAHPVAASFDHKYFSKVDQHRVGMFLIDVADDDIAVPLDASGISHFVEVLVTPTPDAHGWFESSDGANGRVLVAPDDIEAVIHDVLLDIAVFNSMANQFADWSSLAGRRTISEQKVRFAEAKALPSFYGPRNSLGLRYFSLASAFRTPHGIDFTHYLKTWHEFARWLRTLPGEGGPEGEPPLPVTPPSTEDRVRHLFRFFHQMPAQVRSKLNTLPPGKYHIIFPLRRPANVQTRASVAAVFRRAKWRRGAFRILTDADLERLVSSSAIANWMEVGYIGTFTMVVT